MQMQGCEGGFLVPTWQNTTNNRILRKRRTHAHIILCGVHINRIHPPDRESHVRWLRIASSLHACQVPRSQVGAQHSASGKRISDSSDLIRRSGLGQLTHVEGASFAGIMKTTNKFATCTPVFVPPLYVYTCTYNGFPAARQ